MEIKNLIDGNNLNANVVKQATNKNAVILSSGAMKKMQDGQEKFSLLVEFDGRQLGFTPNKISLENISKKYGTETTKWVGKVILLNTQLMSNGKDGVIAQ